MINVQRKTLLDAAELAAKVSSTKAHVLSHYTLRNGRLCVRSSDGESGIETVIEANGEGAGFSVPSIKFASIVKTLNAEEVSITAGDRQTEVGGLNQRGQRFEFRNADPVPQTWPEITGETLTVDAAALARAIERCLPAVSNDVGRFALNGLYLANRDGWLTVCATDGRRMHSERVCVSNLEWSGPVTRKAAQLFLRILTGGSAVITFGPNITHLTCGESQAWALCMTGRFPQVDDSPNPEGVSFDVIAEDACRAIKQALLVQPNGTSRWEVFDGELIIQAESETGSADLRIPVPTDGEAVLSLDSRAALDAFGVHDPISAVRMVFSGSRLDLSSGQWTARIQGSADADQRTA